MGIIYWYEAAGTSREKTQPILVAQRVLILQARLQMLQKSHHPACKTPVKCWSCYIWQRQADGGTPSQMSAIKILQQKGEKTDDPTLQ